MIIRCPYCAFSRTVDEDKIPAAAQTATCPKCGHKFRFRDSDGVVGGDETKASSDQGAGPAEGRSASGTFSENGTVEPESSGHERGGEQGEDIWDRVASLGEHWGDDEHDDSRPGDEASFKPGAAQWESRAPSPAVPWEHIRAQGLLKAFGRTVFQAVFHPGRFFSSLAAPRPLGLALVFYVVVTALQTYLFQAWMHIFPAGAVGFDLSSAHALYADAGPLLVILAAPLVWLVFLVAAAGASFVVLRLISGRAVSLPALMRIMAYASAPMLLSVIPFIGTILGQIWAMVLFLFGCRRVFGLKFPVAAVVLPPVYLCLAVLRIILSGSF